MMYSPFFQYYYFLKNLFCGPDSKKKSSLNLLQYCLCPLFWFFGLEEYGILAPRSGMELSPASEGEVLTTGPPGKSQKCCV